MLPLAVFFTVLWFSCFLVAGHPSHDHVGEGSDSAIPADPVVKWPFATQLFRQMLSDNFPVYRTDGRALLILTFDPSQYSDTRSNRLAVTFDAISAALYTDVLVGFVSAETVLEFTQPTLHLIQYFNAPEEGSSLHHGEIEDGDRFALNGQTLDIVLDSAASYLHGVDPEVVALVTTWVKRCLQGEESPELTVLDQDQMHETLEWVQVRETEQDIDDELTATAASPANPVSIPRETLWEFVHAAERGYDLFLLITTTEADTRLAGEALLLTATTVSQLATVDEDSGEALVQFATYYETDANINIPELQKWYSPDDLPVFFLLPARDQKILRFYGDMTEIQDVQDWCTSQTSFPAEFW